MRERERGAREGEEEERKERVPGSGNRFSYPCPWPATDLSTTCQFGPDVLTLPRQPGQEWLARRKRGIAKRAGAQDGASGARGRTCGQAWQQPAAPLRSAHASPGSARAPGNLLSNLGTEEKGAFGGVSARLRVRRAGGATRRSRSCSRCGTGWFGWRAARANGYCIMGWS
jgi:hypothetical protein